MGILVLGDVGLEGGEGNGRFGAARIGVLGQELVEDLGEDLVRRKRGVFVVADDDTGDALGSRIDVEREV